MPRGGMSTSEGMTITIIRTAIPSIVAHHVAGVGRPSQIGNLMSFSSLKRRDHDGVRLALRSRAETFYRPTTHRESSEGSFNATCADRAPALGVSGVGVGVWRGVSREYVRTEQIFSSFGCSKPREAFRHAGCSAGGCSASVESFACDYYVRRF